MYKNLKFVELSADIILNVSSSGRTDCMLKDLCDSEFWKNLFNGSMLSTAMATGITFSGHPVLVNVISQESLEGIS